MSSNSGQGNLYRVWGRVSREVGCRDLEAVTVKKH